MTDSQTTELTQKDTFNPTPHMLMRTGATGVDYFTCIKCGKLVAEKMFDY